MFSNPFNKASDKPEERRMPPEDKIGKSFITSQVFSFIGKDSYGRARDKNLRMYWGAVSYDNQIWEINKYEYSIKDKNYLEFSGSYEMPRANSLEEAVREIARLESNKPKLIYCQPVPGLEGNYHDFAAQAGGYFDEQNNFISVKGDAALTKDVFLSRGELEKMYKADDAPAAPAAEPAISTWKDYYREVVRKYPLGKTMLIGEESVNTVKILEQKLMDETIPLSSKKNLVNEIIYIDVDPAIAHRRSYYHYNVMVMSALMRAGGKAYGDFASSTSVNPETLKFLSYIADAIEFYATRMVKVSPAQAKQMADMITQGPDPYAAQPLPLEKAFIKKPAPSAKPAVRKTHSP